MKHLKNCPICFSKTITFFFKIKNIPAITAIYFKKRKNAINAPRGDINFAICNQCIFIFNKDYKQINYNKYYYNVSRTKAKIYNTYIDKLASFFSKNLQIVGKKKILEIGHNDGYFLQKILSLKKFKNSKFFAFDLNKYANKKIHKVRVYLKNYSNFYSNKIKPDVLILRHTLEHISDPRNFFNNILFYKPKYIFIEVPHSNLILKKKFEFFNYEHCSYFNEKNLEYLLSQYSYSIKSKNYFLKNENLVLFFEKSKNKNFIDLK